MNIIQFMGNIFQIIIDKLKDQQFSVLLLCIVVVYFWNQNEKIELRLNSKISNVESTLIECNKSRFELSIAVKELETKFSLMHPPKKNK